MTRNGFGATNNDHTPYDAMVTVVMAHYQHLLLEDMGGTWRGNPDVRKFPLPSLVNFDLDSKMLAAMSAARETSLALTKNISVKYYTFSTYGKDFIKSNKLHPDAFVQMSMQLAYIRLHGKPAPTYETATTRQFYNGRTETMRSCTEEAVEFAHAMLNPKVSTSEKRTKLFNAVSRHNEIMQRCQKNEGIDRHLFGLYIVALEAGMDTPEIFLDPAYVKSGGGGNFVLSSSTTGYTPLVGGVAAMVQDGYGCFYNMLPDKLNFFISCFLDSSESRGEALCDALASSLQDMQDVLTAPTASL
ncbi:peroxisomal carnitine O-octanoyltransferase-like [Penaeus indicus]|uniref:peroxisomal carnitine O-octanoyltransferase-like n=1 Tax=Penaeus indicus TaxID=29960 RepID=UPI00300CF5EC